MKIWMLLFALAIPPEISLTGRLMFADILCVGIVMWAFFFKKIPALHPVEKTFYVLASVWLFTQILTDIYVQSDLEDYMRGWLRIIFFMINFTAVRVLVDRKFDRALFLLLAVSIGAALKFYVGSGNIEKTGELQLDWKFGYGSAFTVFTIYAGIQLSRILEIRNLGTLAALGAAAINLSMNARSLFGQTVFAALTGPIMSARKSAKRISMTTILFAGVFVAGGGYLAVTAYSYAASEGILGQAAKDKYNRQTDSGLGLLFSGRTELLGSLDAIADSPVVGYGSYARNAYYADLRLLRLREAGMEVSSASAKAVSDRIPTHSFLFGAWVEAGFLGALFWMWVLYVTCKAMLQVLRQPNRYTSLLIFTAIALGWDILFSPFGLDRRIVIPVYLQIMFLLVASASSRPAAGSARPSPSPGRPRLQGQLQSRRIR